MYRLHGFCERRVYSLTQSKLTIKEALLIMIPWAWTTATDSAMFRNREHDMPRSQGQLPGPATAWAAGR